MHNFLSSHFSVISSFQHSTTISFFLPPYISSFAQFFFLHKHITLPLAHATLLAHLPSSYSYSQGWTSHPSTFCFLNCCQDIFCYHPSHSSIYLLPPTTNEYNTEPNKDTQMWHYLCSTRTYSLGWGSEFIKWTHTKTENDKWLKWLSTRQT